MSDQTYTAADVAAAVDAAVGDLRKELDALRATETAAEIEARVRTAVDEATAPLSATVADLQAKLDEAVLTAGNEKARADALEAAQAEAAEAAAAAARRDERLAIVTEAATVDGTCRFGEKFLADNADRWAAMAAEDFDHAVASYREVTAASAGAAPETPPPTTALHATTDSGVTSTTTKSAIKTLGALRRQGLDPRQLIA